MPPGRVSGSAMQASAATLKAAREGCIADLEVCLWIEAADAADVQVRNAARPCPCHSAPPSSPHSVPGTPRRNAPLACSLQGGREGLHRAPHTPCPARQGNTALHAAAEAGQVGVMVLLLESYKTPPGVANKIGNTPLHVARTPTALTTLLEHGVRRHTAAPCPAEPIRAVWCAGAITATRGRVTGELQEAQQCETERARAEQVQAHVHGCTPCTPPSPASPAAPPLHTVAQVSAHVHRRCPACNAGWGVAGSSREQRHSEEAKLLHALVATIEEWVANPKQAIGVDGGDDDADGGGATVSVVGGLAASPSRRLAASLPRYFAASLRPKARACARHVPGRYSRVCSHA